MWKGRKDQKVITENACSYERKRKFKEAFRIVKRCVVKRHKFKRSSLNQNKWISNNFLTFKHSTYLQLFNRHLTKLLTPIDIYYMNLTSISDFKHICKGPFFHIKIKIHIL